MIEIKLEKLSGESKSGNIGKINVKMGDEIKVGDLLLQVETKKGNVSIKSNANGVIQEIAMDQAEMHGAKTFTHHGYQIGVVQGRTNWDFKNCHGVVEMEAEVKRLKDGLKSMRKSADADGYSEVIELNGQKVLAAPDINGEMLALPVIKFGKSYLTIKSTH